MSAGVLRELEDSIQLSSRDIAHSPEIVRELRKKTFIEVIGPTGVGKSTIIHLITTLNSEFGQTGSFTTRAPRANDTQTGKYRYYPHDLEGLGRIYDSVSEGEIVQVELLKETRKFYGSELVDYPKKYSLLDTIPSSVENNRKLPFASIYEVSLIASDVAWQLWTNYRIRDDKVSDEVILQRLIEGESNLMWSLNQPSPCWVINRRFQQSRTAEKIMRIAKGSAEREPLGEETALGLLRAIQKQRYNYEARL